MTFYAVERVVDLDGNFYYEIEPYTLKQLLDWYGLEGPFVTYLNLKRAQRVCDKLNKMVKENQS